jgi:hypothetical protein
MSPKPAPPGYWMNETGGQLGQAIHRYLDGRELSNQDVALIRLYIQQWIGSEVWDWNPHLDEEGRAQLAGLREAALRFLTDRKAIDAWIELATELGVDPL